MPTSGTILIIEDDKFLSQVLKGRLEKEGFSVILAFDGEEGMEKIREINPSLVVLDLIMPKVSGFEFLEKVAADPQVANVPIVVVSNLAQDVDIEKAKRLGVRDYYVKVRTSIDELIKIFKNMLEPQA